MVSTKELIVARYNEPVDWVLESPIPTTVYNKGEPLDLEADHVEVIEIPNLGREAGTILAHICRNWETLADWSYFVQGEPHQSIESLWRRLVVDYDDTTSLTDKYLPDFPNDSIKGLDLVEDHGGNPVRYGLADWFGNRPPEANRAWLDATWRQFFDCPRPDPHWFGYCASFAVPASRIKARPLEYWLWLREIAHRADNATEMVPTSAWGFETVWLYLWSDADKYPGKLIPSGRTKLDKPRAKGCGCGNKEAMKRALNK